MSEARSILTAREGCYTRQWWDNASYRARSQLNRSFYAGRLTGNICRCVDGVELLRCNKLRALGGAVVALVVANSSSEAS
jgi:hypothetical protein